MHVSDGAGGLLSVHEREEASSVDERLHARACDTFYSTFSWLQYKDIRLASSPNEKCDHFCRLFRGMRKRVQLASNDPGMRPHSMSHGLMGQD